MRSPPQESFFTMGELEVDLSKTHMGVSKNSGKTPQNGWFIMEHHIKMDDLGIHLFLETPNMKNQLQQKGHQGVGCFWALAGA